jgi:hypothetical protein
MLGSDSLPQQFRETLLIPPRMRKRTPIEGSIGTRCVNLHGFCHYALVDRASTIGWRISQARQPICVKDDVLLDRYDSIACRIFRVLKAMYQYLIPISSKMPGGKIRSQSVVQIRHRVIDNTTR